MRVISELASEYKQLTVEGETLQSAAPTSTQSVGARGCVDERDRNSFCSRRTAAGLSEAVHIIVLTCRTKVFLSKEPADMRASNDTVFNRAKDVLKEDPFSGHIFVYLNKRRTCCKCPQEY